MMLSSLRRSQRPVSAALIMCFIFEFAIPLGAYAAPAASGGGTVASSLSNMVDGYTGDFRYSVPLVTVPGPNGENVSIDAGYRAGITVNQKASWTGLGWDYNPGEISRQVVGTPDDYNGVSTDQYSTYEINSNGLPHQVTAMFGSLYNNEFNRNPYGGATSNYKAGDNMTAHYSISASERVGMIMQVHNGNGYNISSLDPNSNATYRFNRHTVPYTGLAYDRYSVSGEGIGGSIHPYYLGSVHIHPEMHAGANSEPVSSKKCQFYFESSTTMSVNETNLTNPDVVNQTTNRIHSGTFVKYFTNSEINNNNNLYDHSHPSGYLDYKPVTNVSATRRVLQDHPADAIGAFQVTNPAGMTYHYSLPVYEQNNLNAIFDGNGRSRLTLLSSDYATSWKLTAITGPDYEDANGNYTADEGDTGYWIAYNYSLWSSDYEWASQRYNAKSDALISPKMTNLVTSAAVGNSYSRNSSLSFGHSQVYVLNYIRTATHSAYFVKSIRDDEQSYRNVMNILVKPVASLKLERVVLLRNEDKHLLINNTSLGGSDLDNRFEYSSCSSALNDPNFVNITRYNANKTAIDAVALSTAELSYNYSLAKKYTGNINNSFTVTSGKFAPWSMPGHVISPVTGSWYRIITGYSGTTASGNNGKLTLKKVTIYSLKGQKIAPSVDFSYNESSSTKNPDFDGEKTDLWGYYKSDYVNSHFVTAVSKDDVDAWSLREINTSLGGKIEISYESDRYHREGFAGDAPFYRVYNGSATGAHANMPSLIFPISNINVSTGAVTFHDYDFSQFVHFVNEPVSDSTYLHPMYTIYSQVEECIHPPVLYNNGNSYYNLPVYRTLIRYGNQIGSNTGTGTGPYTNLLTGSQPEYNVNCGRPGYSLGTVSRNAVGVDHAVVFRSYLYGGGIRVNAIKITDPFSGNNYTQKFEYGDGYCPVVPKPTDFSTYSGPSNHDVVMNLKPLMAPQLTGHVGYNSCTQYSSGQNNQRTATLVQEYHNNLIAKPLSMIAPGMTLEPKRLCSMMGVPAGNSCLSKPYLIPGNIQHPLCGRYVLDYKIKIDLNMNSGSLLGKVKSLSDGINYTKYYYQASSIKESYSHPKRETVTYTNEVVHPDTVPANANYEQCRFPYTFKDEYNYDKSDAYTVSYFLSSTETVKDGIRITEDIRRFNLTGAPYYTKTTDPTRGVYENSSYYAFQESASGGSTRLYPGMDLKSKNENNRNLLTAVAYTSIVKNSRYMISHSKATYSNVYPVRLLGGNIQNITKPWYHLHETYERLLDDDVLISTVSTSADWRKLSTNTLYDSAYNCIEQEGLNGRRAASRWGYGGLHKLADISNANYNSFAFSGFEDPVAGPGHNNILYGGEVSNGQTSVQAVMDNGNMIRPHTGWRMAGVQPSSAGPGINTKNFDVGRVYVAKVWVHKFSPPAAALSISINGTAGGTYTDTKTVVRSNPDNVTVGDWVLMSVEIEVPANFNTGAPHQMTVNLSNPGAGTAYFDDLAFHPKDAVMTGNVYDEKTGALIAQLDNENFATIYHYDNALRLTSATKEYSGGLKKITETIYHYAKP